jgi:hypothetical protein
MTIPGMAARDKHSINPALKSLEDKEGIDSTGAGDSDHPDVRWILNPRCSSKICARIRTPVTEES